MYVTKRNGSKTQLDLTQVRKQTNEACRGLNNLSPDEIESNLNIFIYDGIKTSEIQKSLIKTANSLISLDKPDYIIAAGRLALYDLYHRIKRLYGKEGSGDVYKKVSLKDYLEYNKDIFSEFVSKYNDDEINTLNSYIVSERDSQFTYPSVIMMFDMYLAKKNGVISELPQHMHMGIAMFVMQNEDKEKRLEYIKELYDATSKLEYINPTPINSNSRLKHGGLISCLINTFDDSLDHIMKKYTEIAFGSKNGAGWGIDISRLRSIKSNINIVTNGSQGKIPFAKVLNDLLLAVNQNGRIYKFAA